MKKFYATVIILAIGLCLANRTYSQLTADNLVIYRYGNGTITNSTAPVFIDEYKQGGQFVQSIPFPVTNSSGSYALTGLPFTSSAIPVEGLITLSADRNYLSVIGYNVSIGGTTGQVGKAVGIIGADGLVNTSTYLSNDKGSPRAAVVGAGGTGVWFATTATTGVDNSAGLKYVAAGTNTTANANRISSDNSQYRSVLEFGGNLYATRGGNSFYRIETMPVNGSNAVTTYTLSGSTTLSQIVLFDTNEDNKPDVLYAADDSSTGIIRKYLSEDGGATWTAKGTITKDGVTNGIKSITGKMISGVVTLYMTTTGIYGNTDVKSSLFKIIDNTPLTSELNAIDNDPAILVEAPSGTMFRGVAFTPGSTVLPVQFISFKAASKEVRVDLSWATASERNNSHFEILRSTGSGFQKIGTVQPSNAQSLGINEYSFSDTAPRKGSNYYKIRQVDYDGESTETAIVLVNIKGLGNEDVKIVGTRQELHITIEEGLKGEGDLYILNMDGKKLINQKVLFSSDLVGIKIPHNLPVGIYIGVLKDKNQNYRRVKFLIQ